MKKINLLVFSMTLILFACTHDCCKKDSSCAVKPENNPLVEDFNTPFGVPLFDSIKLEHFMPAYKYAYELQKQDINQIIDNTEKPNFDNTILKLHDSYSLVSKIDNIFSNLNSAITNPEMQQLSKDLIPLESEQSDFINFNTDLFNKIKLVFENKSEFNLNNEQEKLLENTYKSFVRSGALLSDESKKRYSEINKELSELTIQFGENNINENNNYKLVIENENDLEGLTKSLIDAAAQTAIEDSLEGKWVFKLHKTSLLPFLTYAKNRSLREQIYKAFINTSNNNDSYDNKEIAAKIANLRLEQANLLGFESYSAYVLDENMAKTPDKVYDLLNKVWEKALPAAKKEVAEMQKLIDESGENFKLEAWDWWYYAEKLKEKKYNFNTEELKKYFEINNVLEGSFMVANNLYGISFIERTDLPKYHTDVRVFEVLDSDSSHIGILYTDFYQRESKRSGAWMTSFRKQHIKDGIKYSPIISYVCNFPKPTGDQPCLLDFREVETLFHEFGHALHGLLSKCTYKDISGTAVSRDFVELPSQIMENWANEKDVLKLYAKNYETGEAIDEELLNKMKASSLFNNGFVVTELIAASLLDMKWHTITTKNELTADVFEKNALDEIGLIPEIASRYRTTYFGHIFKGGYASGYYGYTWAAVLDADAYAAFKETGDIFNKDVATSFRKNILEKGGTENAMKMYIDFRGAEPNPKAYLERNGMLN